MPKVTYVVEYDEGKVPSVFLDMEIAGGKLKSVLWSDYQEDYLSAEQVDIVDEALIELSSDEYDHDAHQEIIKKLRLISI